MTKEEKLNPALLNGSRIRRIAIGSGTKPEDVRSLLKRYELMKSQIKILKRNRNFIKKLGGAYKV
jgi:signal recognition particle subunit FFH/SRP54 (srp54)